MTETRFTWRWLLVIAVVGIFMGLAVGLAAGWIIFPNIGSSNIAGLSASSQNDYIVLVANTFAYDRDDAAAKRRLGALQDKDIKTRLERLAKALAARKDTAAANVADLALELGSEDSSIMVLAEQVVNTGDPSVDTEPTKSARSDGGSETTSETPAAAPGKTTAPKATATPTEDEKKPKPARQTQTALALSNSDADPTQPSEEATDEPTDIPATKAPAATKAPTAEPTAAAPAPAPVTTEFIPAYPGGWWDAVQFIPAQVAPGQQYWHLKYARYCDWAPDDKHETCPGFPGGGMGTSIYVMTVDESGACVTTDVNDDINDGSKYPLTTDAIKKIDYPWNPYNYPCTQNYEKGMYGEGNSISVPGLPSDKITELSLCSKSPPAGYNPPPCGHVHVRYFLIFQRTTR